MLYTYLNKFNQRHRCWKFVKNANKTLFANIKFTNKSFKVAQNSLQKFWKNNVFQHYLQYVDEYRQKKWRSLLGPCHCQWIDIKSEIYFESFKLARIWICNKKGKGCILYIIWPLQGGHIFLNRLLKNLNASVWISLFKNSVTNIFGDSFEHLLFVFNIDYFFRKRWII